MGMYTKKVEEALGLKEKNNNEFYGEYKGYELTLYVTQQGFEGYLNFYSSQSIRREAINIFINTVNKSITTANESPFGIHFLTNGFTFKSSMEKLIGKLDAVVNYLSQNNIPGIGCCMDCGKESQYLETVKLNDVYVTLDNECSLKLSSQVEEEKKEFDEKPNNYLKGTLGALIGVGIACVAWVILYFLGFLSMIIAILAVFLGNYFYVKLGGKANNVKTIIVAALSLVGLLLTCLFVYLYFAKIFMITENITSMTPFEYIMNDAEMKSAFTHDMIMNAVFTVIGVVIQYSSTKKKDQNNQLRISK